MSTKIHLFFSKTPDIDLCDKGFFLIRLFCNIRFERDKQFSKPEVAIIDTGAPVSLIPKSIWTGVDVQKFKKIRLKGLVRKSECSIPVIAGIISGILVDEYGNTKQIIFRTYLAETDEIPLIVGYQDVLEKCSLHIYSEGKVSYLEFC